MKNLTYISIVFFRDRVSVRIPNLTFMIHKVKIIELDLDDSLDKNHKIGLL